MSFAILQSSNFVYVTGDLSLLLTIIVVLVLSSSVACNISTSPDFPVSIVIYSFLSNYIPMLFSFFRKVNFCLLIFLFLFLACNCSLGYFILFLSLYWGHALVEWAIWIIRPLEGLPGCHSFSKVKFCVAHVFNELQKAFSAWVIRLIILWSKRFVAWVHHFEYWNECWQQPINWNR